LHVFPDLGRTLVTSLQSEVSRHPPNYPGRSEPTASPRLICMLNDVEKNLTNALFSLGRNDVIGAVALVSIAVFPLIADAQLGRGSGAVKMAQDVSAVGAPVRSAVARPDSCTDQHWPFYSAGCLHQSTQAAEPRLISMNETSPNSAATGDVPNGVQAVGSKKPGKPRIATHRRDRRPPNVNYATNLQAMPGW
jgi:hypothetical protein